MAAIFLMFPKLIRERLLVMSVIRLAGATLTLLIVLEAASEFAAAYLPLGGTQIIQMAIVLGFAFAMSEILSIFKG